MATQAELLLEIQDICRRVFQESSLIISRETMAAQVEKWDSLNHIKFIVALEKRFGLRFDLDELNDLQNIGEVVDLIGKKITNPT